MFGISKILGFLKGLDLRIILLILVFLLSGFTYWQISKKNEFKERLEVQRNNIAALQDSVRDYRTKTGELGQEKLALQVTVEDLKIANEELSEELEKEKGNVKTITKVETVVERDTVFVDSSRISQVGLNSYKIDWTHYEDGKGWSRRVSGYSTFYFNFNNDTPYGPETVITTDFLNTSIVTGIVERDGKKTIFVRSAYPYMTFTKINGAVIDDELYSSPKRWGIGPSLGYALDVYSFRPFPYIGIGVNYNIIR